MINDVQAKRALRLMIKGLGKSAGIPEIMYVGLRHFVTQLLDAEATERLDCLVELDEDKGIVVSKVTIDILVKVVFDGVDCGKEEETAILL